MKLTLQQLSSHLTQRNFPAPAYLVSGDEILFAQEALDMIRAGVQKAGFSERMSFTVDNHFDWSLFREASVSDSLFSERQLIELQLKSTKFNDIGKNLLLNFLQKPPSDKCLLLSAEKLDAAVQKTSWFKALMEVGVFLPVWPLQAHEFPKWIQQRLSQLGFSANPDGLALIADLTEGNLLSTAQLIEKLSLLYPPGRLTFEQIREVGSDNARYSVFDLMDKILQGEPAAILRVLQTLQEEGVEPTLILWAMTREVRELIRLMTLIKNGQPLSQVLNTQRVWEKRKPWIARTLRAHSDMTLYRVLQSAGEVDLLIKGMAVGSVWNELCDVSLMLAGVPKLALSHL